MTDAHNDPGIPTDARLNIEQPYTLPDPEAGALNDIWLAEQWVQNLGIREIITGLGSADTAEFIRGVRKLKMIIETQRTEAYERGRQHIFQTASMWFGIAAVTTSIFWMIAWRFFK